MTLASRRVVTSQTDEGTSCFVLDGPAPQVVKQLGRGLTFHELWATGGRMTDVGGPFQDAGARRPTHHPSPGGTKVRLVEFLPDSHRDAAAVVSDMERIEAADRAVHHDDPTFHANDTVDYNIVLSGEIYAVTETGETLLGPGDVLIQRGTAHTWSNRSDRPCVYLSVMVSAVPMSRATS